MFLSFMSWKAVQEFGNDVILKKEEAERLRQVQGRQVAFVDCEVEEAKS